MSEDEKVVKFDPNRKPKPRQAEPAKPGAKYIEIRGEKFDSIKAKKTALHAMIDEAKKKIKAAHDELCEEIKNSAPEMNKSKAYGIDTEYEDLGFYIIKEIRNDGSLFAFLNNLID